MALTFIFFVCWFFGSVAARIPLDQISCSPDGLNTREMFSEIQNYPDNEIKDDTKKYFAAGGQSQIFISLYRGCHFLWKCFDFLEEAIREYTLLRVLAMEYIAETFFRDGNCIAMPMYDFDLTKIFYDPQHRKSVPVDEVTHYALNLLAGMSHLHRFGWVHMDMKLDNALVDIDGHKALISDLGIAVRENHRIKGSTFDYCPLDIPGNVNATFAHDYYMFGYMVLELFNFDVPDRVEREDISREVALEMSNSAFEELNPFLYEEHSTEWTDEAGHAPVELLLAVIDRNPCKRPGPDVTRDRLLEHADRRRKADHSHRHNWLARKTRKYLRRSMKRKHELNMNKCLDFDEDASKYQKGRVEIHSRTYPEFDLASLQMGKPVGELVDFPDDGNGISISEGSFEGCKMYIWYSDFDLSKVRAVVQVHIPGIDGDKNLELYLVGIAYGNLDGTIPQRKMFPMYQSEDDVAIPVFDVGG